MGKKLAIFYYIQTHFTKNITRFATLNLTMVFKIMKTTNSEIYF